MAGALLHNLLQAHGGLQNWRSVTAVSASVRSGGLMLGMKFLQSSARRFNLEISTQEIRTRILDFPRPGQVGIYTLEDACIQTMDGELVAGRSYHRHPGTLTGGRLNPDPLDFIYISGAAMWRYFNIPFLFVTQGATVEERGPVSENGHNWMCIRVVLPEKYALQDSEHLFYLDESGLIGRFDDRVLIAGKWVSAAHYCTGYRHFSGIAFPTQRQVYPSLGGKASLRFVKALNITLEDARLLRRKPSIQPI